MKTVVGVFKSEAEAEGAAEALQDLGIPLADISVVAGDDASRYKEYHEKASRGYNVEASAEAGAKLGAGIGLVAGLVALAIPGIGPIIAGGAIATMLASLGVGAAGGGLIAAFVQLGIPQEEAPVYAEAVRRGAIMVAARVEDDREEDAIGAIKRNGGHDLRIEPENWQEDWPAHEPAFAERYDEPKVVEGPPPPKYSPD